MRVILVVLFSILLTGCSIDNALTTNVVENVTYDIHVEQGVVTGKYIENDINYIELGPLKLKVLDNEMYDNIEYENYVVAYNDMMIVKDIKENITPINKSLIEVKGTLVTDYYYTMVDFIKTDIDYNGINDTIEVSADIKHDELGNVIETDGMNWDVRVIMNGDTQYNLIGEYIKDGKLDVTVFEDPNGIVIVLEDIREDYVDIRTFRYNKEIFEGNVHVHGQDIKVIHKNN